MDIVSLKEGLRQVAGRFLPRSGVERDPSYKQLIPYLLVQSLGGGVTAVYRRNGSERRLQDLLSIGVGGHICPADAPTAAHEMVGIIQNGLRREMHEEFCHLPTTRLPGFLGIINDEHSDVGRVHLGLVFRLELEQPALVKPGPELHDFQWIATPQLGQLRLEGWSQLALRLLTSRASRVPEVFSRGQPK